MKKTIAILMAAIMAMASLTGCGGPQTETNANTSETSQPKVTGTVSMNGSPQWRSLSRLHARCFNAEYPDVTASGQFTGSGTGIEAVANGTADIGNSSRALKEEEKAKGLIENIVAIDGIAVITDQGKHRNKPYKGAACKDLHRWD